MNEDPIGLWQHLHGATTHFPIALAIASLAFDLGAVLFKKDVWRTVGFWLVMGAAVACVPAIASGLYYIYADAKGLANVEAMGDVTTVTNHRNVSLVAGSLLIFLALWRAAAKDSLNKKALAVYLILAVLMVSGIGYAGYLGGYLGHGYWGALTPPSPAAEGAQ